MAHQKAGQKTYRSKGNIYKSKTTKPASITKKQNIKVIKATAFEYLKSAFFRRTVAAIRYDGITAAAKTNKRIINDRNICMCTRFIAYKYKHIPKILPILQILVTIYQHPFDIPTHNPIFAIPIRIVEYDNPL
jgi:hypothetical protein